MVLCPFCVSRYPRYLGNVCLVGDAAPVYLVYPVALFFFLAQLQRARKGEENHDRHQPKHVCTAGVRVCTHSVDTLSVPPLINHHLSARQCEPATPATPV